MNRQRIMGAVLISVAVALTAAACGDTAATTSGETHFLMRCSGECGAGYSCLCGVCTEECSDDSDCGGLPGEARCGAVNEGACGESASICDVSCDEDADCAELGADYGCYSGACRRGVARTGLALSYCDGECGDGYSCRCGVCTEGCNEDADCVALGPDARCFEASIDSCNDSGSFCGVRCLRGDECAALGDDYRCEYSWCVKGTPEPEIDCPPGCTVLRGHPEGDVDGCVDMQAGEDQLIRGVPVACTCDPVQLEMQCTIRQSDGTRWLLPDNTFTDEEAWVPCNDDQRNRMATACYYTDCPPERRPESQCSLERFCSLTWTVNDDFHLEVCDQHYDRSGCLRESCTSDEQCADEEYCRWFPIVETEMQAQANGGCQGLAEVGENLAGSCHPAEPAGPLCDFSREIRLMFQVGSAGGPFDSFLLPYGSSAFLLSGSCQFWAGPDETGALITGTFDSSQGWEFETGIGWKSLSDWGELEDTDECDDGSLGFAIRARGTSVECHCGCDTEDLNSAINMGLEATDTPMADDLAPSSGAVRAVVFEFDEDFPQPEGAPVFEWPLSRVIEDLITPPTAIRYDSGLVFEPNEEANAVRLLRELRIVNYEGPEGLGINLNPVIVVDDGEGNLYGLLVRDELPAELRESVDALMER